MYNKENNLITLLPTYNSTIPPLPAPCPHPHTEDMRQVAACKHVQINQKARLETGRDLGLVQHCKFGGMVNFLGLQAMAG